MAINIGDNNRIKNTIISENSEIDRNQKNKDTRKKSLYEKHPIVISFLISLVAGIILLFPVWSKLIGWIMSLY